MLTRFEKYSKSDKSKEIYVIQADPTEIFFPKYLTSQRLFKLMEANPDFRRQALLQCLIVFQFLNTTSLEEKNRLGYATNHSVRYAYALSTEDTIKLCDVKLRTQSVLEAITPGGKVFSRAVLTILAHENNWVLWKHLKCDSFELMPILVSAKSIKPKWRESHTSEPEWMGNKQLTLLWKQSKNLLALLAKNNGRKNLSLYMKDLDYQVGKDGETLEEGIENVEDLLYNDMRWNWLAYRTATRSNLSLFSVECVIDGERPGKSLLMQWRAEKAGKLQSFTQPLLVEKLAEYLPPDPVLPVDEVPATVAVDDTEYVAVNEADTVEHSDDCESIPYSPSKSIDLDSQSGMELDPLESTQSIESGEFISKPATKKQRLGDYSK